MKREEGKTMTLQTCKASVGRRFILATIFAAAAAPALAQGSFPGKQVTFVVPVPAGTLVDIIPRIIAQKLADRWGQPVVVENKPGAASKIGAEYVNKAQADGHTLLVSPPGILVLTPHLERKLAYDPTAFIPVSVIVSVPMTIVAGSKVSASTIQELLAYARANPDKLTFGSPGIGSPPHLAMEALMIAAGVKLVHVPYQGLGLAQSDLLAGHIDLMIDSVGNVSPHARDGKLKMLAIVTGGKRVDGLPDTPAITELLPEFHYEEVIVVAAPPKTPGDIASQISQAIAEIIRMPDIAQRFRDLSVMPVGASPDETAAILKRQSDGWRDVVAKTGIKLD